MNSVNSKNMTLIVMLILILLFAGGYVLIDSTSNKDSIYTKIINIK